MKGPPATSADEAAQQDSLVMGVRVFLEWNPHLRQAKSESLRELDEGEKEKIDTGYLHLHGEVALDLPSVSFAKRSAHPCCAWLME